MKFYALIFLSAHLIHAAKKTEVFWLSNDKCEDSPDFAITGETSNNEECKPRSCTKGTDGNSSLVECTNSYDKYLRPGDYFEYSMYMSADCSPQSVKIKGAYLADGKCKKIKEDMYNSMITTCDKNLSVKKCVDDQCKQCTDASPSTNNDGKCENVFFASATAKCMKVEASQSTASSAATTNSHLNVAFGWLVTIVLLVFA